MYNNVPKINLDDILRIMEEKHSVVYKTAIKRAFKYASDMHKNVLRNSGEPYVNHPARVAYTIAEWGLDNDTVIAALLHDVVEDCGVTPDELAERFNLSIANLVDNVSSVDATITDEEKSFSQNLTSTECQRLN